MSSETADGADISIDVGELIMGIFILSIIPIGIGMAWIHFQPNLTERLQKPLKILAALLISAVVVAAVVTYLDLFTDSFSEEGVPTAFLNVVMMALSYGLAWLFGLPRSQRITIGLASDM